MKEKNTWKTNLMVLSLFWKISLGFLDKDSIGFPLIFECSMLDSTAGQLHKSSTSEQFQLHAFCQISLISLSTTQFCWMILHSLRHPENMEWWTPRGPREFIPTWFSLIQSIRNRSDEGSATAHLQICSSKTGRICSSTWSAISARNLKSWGNIQVPICFGRPTKLIIFNIYIYTVYIYIVNVCQNATEKIHLPIYPISAYRLFRSFFLGGLGTSLTTSHSNGVCLVHRTSNSSRLLPIGVANTSPPEAVGNFPPDRLLGHVWKMTRSTCFLDLRKKIRGAGNR